MRHRLLALFVSLVCLCACTSFAQQVFTVADPGDAPADSVPVFFPPTLRAAIQCANYNPDLDEIRFVVPVIQPTSALPVVFWPVTIDGSQGTSSKVILDGAQAVGPFGLFINTAGATVKDVEIRNFVFGGIALQGPNHTILRCDIHNNSGPGINLNNVTNSFIIDNKIYASTGTGGYGISVIQSSNNNIIENNFIGTADGITASANSRAGILLRSQFNVIRNNVISGNAAEGISITAAGSDTSRGNLIDGNKIGTNAAGDGALGNVTRGVDAFIGISDTLRGNIISGNGTIGISISNPTRGLIIEGNLIGPKLNGTDSLGNSTGINSSGSNILIRNNTISSNRSAGVSLQDGAAIVQGNKIGTNVSGSFRLGNSVGIGISGGDGHVIGGPDPLQGNTISGNRGDGVTIQGTGANVIVQGNFIGTNIQGTLQLANGGDGVAIFGGASDNAVSENVIAGNKGNGVRLGSSSMGTHNIVKGNRIGTNEVGNSAIPNNQFGILILNSANNTIGGNRSTGDDNLISGNDSGGVSVRGSSSSGNHITGNLIGTNQSGTQPLRNRGHGIIILNADSNVIGGMTADSANVISGNDSSGVAIIGNGSTYNVLRVNIIGRSITGATEVPNTAGVTIRGGQRNTVGGTSTGYLNFISGNIGNGITIMGDSNTVQRNSIHSNGRNLATQRGTGHGIFIEGNNNRIGGAIPFTENLITDNGGAGIFINAGMRNTILRDTIFDNRGLGIDLAPEGVTKNDSADIDQGPNGLQNFPVVDSARAEPVESTFVFVSRVFGRLVSKANRTYLIEFYVNERCDSPRYGEGRRPVDTTYVTVAANDTGVFSKQLPVLLDTNLVLSMTATDDSGSTSEFSRCWPKFLKIVDGRDSVMRYKDFIFSKVRNDPPTFTETLIDTFTTTEEGRILLGETFYEEGDSIKVYRRMHVEPSAKHTADLPVTAYTVHLDNARFDSATFAMSFDKLDSSVIQTIKVDHTTVAYNMLVSIEWDAETRYIDSLMAGFRRLSNYMYDVYDGQVRLDTIRIVDEKRLWNRTDIRTHANNIQWPETWANGIARATPDTSELNMPRRWFGGTKSGRNMSVTEDPLNPGAAHHFRTIGHEFGHYIGFYDEYKPFIPPPRCPLIDNYGYMDYHYDNVSGRLQSSTELSWSRQYLDTDCRNTRQWKWNGNKSCWNMLEELYERVLDGIFVPVIRPEERWLMPGADYFNGPNDYASPLNYDVGALVVFPEPVTGPAAETRLVRVLSAIPPIVPLGGMTVIHGIPGTGAIVQGQSADDGRIKILGYHSGVDLLLASGPGVIVGGRNRVDDSFAWYSGQTQITTAETTLFSLNRVNGDLPLICRGSVQASAVQVQLRWMAEFDSLPTLQVFPNAGGTSTYSFTSTDSTYIASITDNIGSSGRMMVNAMDTAFVPFFFDLYYRIGSVDSSTREIFAMHGDALVSLDTSLTGIEKIMLVSTQYPVLRTGLPAGIQQVSRAHSLSAYPSGAFAGFNQISIQYEDIDTTSPTIPQIYHWNDVQSRWELTNGSSVDSIRRTVSAPITQTGVYAAFAYDIPNDVEPEGSLVPDRFELFQNYPNPFNSTTNIRFSVPTASRARLEVFNIIGQRVETLLDADRPAGYHTVKFDTQRLASGVYFYRLDAAGVNGTGYVKVNKMLLLK